MEVDLFPLFLTRYLAAVGLTWIIYDHVLTFDLELKYIWKRGQWDYIKVYFLWNRYVGEVCLILGVYLTAGRAENLTTAKCKALTTTASTLYIVCLASGTATVTWKVYMLWDQRRSALLVLAVAFIIAYSGVFASFVVSTKDVYNKAQILGSVCALPRPAAMIGIWVPLLFFNVFAFLLAIANALSRPYKQNVEVMNRLRRDGAFSFVWMTVSCILNLMTYFVGGISGTFYSANVTWALDSVALSRLVLEFEAVKSRAYAAQPCIAFQDMPEMNSFPHAR